MVGIMYHNNKSNNSNNNNTTTTNNKDEHIFIPLCQNQIGLRGGHPESYHSLKLQDITHLYKVVPPSDVCWFIVP